MPRRLAGAVGLAASLAVWAGFAGDGFRPADTLALARPVFGLLALAGLFAGWPLRAFALSAIVATALTTVPPFFSAAPGGELSVYSKNLWYDRADPEALAADILASGADVVLLQELSDLDAEIARRLADTHPHQHHCPEPHRQGVAIASRHPFDGTPLCTDTRAVALAPIRVAGIRVWVASIHIPWPWPVDSRAAEAQARAMLTGLDAPLVAGGDFNAFPWSARVSNLAAITSTRLAGPTRATLRHFGVPLPIDHVLAPGGGTIAYRPKFASDHAGLFASVALH